MCGMKSSAIWVAAAALAPWAAGAVEVSGASLTATLDEEAKGAVTRLVTAHGAELAPTGVSTPIFRLKLTRADDFTKSVVMTADDAETCSLEEGAQNAARFVYGGFKEGVLFVSCTAQGGGTHVRWRISVQTAPGWAVEETEVEETEFPRLLVSPVLGSDGGDDRFVFGTAKGGVTHNPGARSVGWYAGAQQPGPLVAQFATVYDDRAGFYFAAEDAAGYTKYIGVVREADGLAVFSRRLGFDEGNVEQAYDVVSGGFEGTVADPCTWHDAADLYKAWAVKQKWCEKTFEQRDDIPAWMRDAPAMVRFGREWIEQPDNIRAWMQNYWKREFVPSPLVVAFWGWEKHGYWVTPDYTPTVATHSRGRPATTGRACTTSGRTVRSPGTTASASSGSAIPTPCSTATASATCARPAGCAGETAPACAAATRGRATGGTTTSAARFRCSAAR